jgi:hypothetical protein
MADEEVRPRHVSVDHLQATYPSHDPPDAKGSDHYRDQKIQGDNHDRTLGEAYRPSATCLRSLRNADTNESESFCLVYRGCKPIVSAARAAPTPPQSVCKQHPVPITGSDFDPPVGGIWAPATHANHLRLIQNDLHSASNEGDTAASNGERADVL